jgi:hypothetical protein
MQEVRMRRALLLTVLVTASAARGQPLPEIHSVWIPSEGVEAREAIPALLTVPAGWSVGDAAVLVVAPQALRATRPALSDALLAEDAAVLEITLRGRPAAPWLGSAVRHLVHQQGAGLVVAIGPASAGEALDAAARRARYAPPTDHLRALAAAIILPPDGASFIQGAAPEPEQGWPQRAPLLCAALARAAPLAASDCVSALLAPSRPSLAAVP